MCVILGKIAKTTGFPKKGTRLPTAAEWNLIGNLFNWLYEHRQMDLPPTHGSGVRALTGPSDRLLVGSSGSGGLANVHGVRHAGRFDHIAFRVLAVL